MSRQYLLRAQLGPWIEFDDIYALLNMTSPFVLLQASRYVYCMYIHVGDHVRSLCVYDVCIKEKRSSGEERSAFPQKKREERSAVGCRIFQLAHVLRHATFGAQCKQIKWAAHIVRPIK
jgi:hypothetical protein